MVRSGPCSPPSRSYARYNAPSMSSELPTMLTSASVCLSTVMPYRSLGKVRKLSVLENQKRPALRAGEELFPRNVECLIRQLERSMVDRDAGLGGQDVMCSDRFIGSHMHRRHEPAWFVRADR